MFENSEEALERLRSSKFRAGFHLSKKDAEYAKAKGYEVIKSHAQDFVKTRLSEAYPENDGKQTPMKNHPVFNGKGTIPGHDQLVIRLIIFARI